MHVNDLIDLFVNSVKKQDVAKEVPYLQAFKLEKRVRELVEPCQKNSKHHREREQHYTRELEKVETKLREEGISVEAIDPRTGYAFQGSICSGSISMGNSNTPTNISNMPKFQAKINQDMLSAVETAKTKMLEHRAKAEQFEKYARAFSVAPETAKVWLTVDDIYYFKLEA